MGIDIVPFQDKYIEEAGALLAERHRRDRLSLPELPTRCEDPAVASASVAAAWQQAGATGVAALRAGRLLGYMLGRPLIDETWSRSAWVRPAGCALALDEDAELVRTLYAALAAPGLSTRGLPAGAPGRPTHRLGQPQRCASLAMNQAGRRLPDWPTRCMIAMP